MAHGGESSHFLNEFLHPRGVAGKAYIAPVEQVAYCRGPGLFAVAPGLEFEDPFHPSLFQNLEHREAARALLNEAVRSRVVP